MSSIQVPSSGPTGGPPSRLVIDEVSPVVTAGRYPVKRVVGEPVDVGARVFADGHDHLLVAVAWRAPGHRTERLERMWAVEPGLDRWQGRWTPSAVGVHRFRVVAWVDEFASWLDGTRRKVDAGQDVASEMLEGAQLLDHVSSHVPRRLGDRLKAWCERLRAGEIAALAVADDGTPRCAAELYRSALRLVDAGASGDVVVDVERELALCSAWYELFPRSWGPRPGVHGTFADVATQLDYVADMGFDIVYLPPVHPIGDAHRKGPDNAGTAGPDDPGSPWAIGSAEGGHTALHPELGTLDEFRALVAAAQDRGLEVALDIALQCSPDHPWVRDHPGWFRHRPDGTIHYAENPPKKYQDIYPLDFGCADWPGLWEACLGIFTFWAEQGVRVFRVDNPHTKPFAFWEWCLAEVRRRCPEAIFLSEAFTRPAVMHHLASVGFTQSYNYFPWRVSAGELTDYFTELSSAPSADRLRPSSWPNTPDILPWHLQRAAREQFAIRLVLAATLSPSYGIYGPAFELCENRPTDNGKEEYAASEKYELRWWDRASPDSLRGLIAAVNALRRDHLALRTLRTLTFHGSTNDRLLVFSKTAHHGAVTDPALPAENPILVVVNLDAEAAQAATLELDLARLGIDPVRPYDVHDVLGGEHFCWQGTQPYVELRPERLCAHVLRVSQEPAS